MQEALYTKRPDFVQKSQLRVDFLQKIKEQRIEHAEKYKMWIEEVYTYFLFCNFTRPVLEAKIVKLSFRC